MNASSPNACQGKGAQIGEVHHVMQRWVVRSQIWYKGAGGQLAGLQVAAILSIPCGCTDFFGLELEDDHKCELRKP